MIFIVVLSTAFDARAASLFLPDSDTAALISLASNSASTVANTMEILKVARETGEKIDHYNNLALRQYFKARRAEQNVRELLETGRMRPRNLRELNGELSGLKANLRELKDTIDAVAMDIRGVENFTDRQWEKLASSERDQKEFHHQEMLSASGGPSKNHVQNTAINTAMTGTVLAKMRRDNLEYQKIDLGIKKTVATENLRRQQFYKEWMQ